MAMSRIIRAIIRNSERISIVDRNTPGRDGICNESMANVLPMMLYFIKVKAMTAFTVDVIRNGMR